MRRSWVTETIVLPLFAAAASFLAVDPLLHAYEVPGATALFAVAAVAPTVITVVVARVWGLRPAFSYSISVVGLVVLLFAGAGLHPVAIAQGFAQGPSRLVSETLPLTGSRGSLAAPVVLTWLCGAATTELLFRRRTRSGQPSPAGFVVPVIVYVLSYSAGVSAPHHDHLAGPLLLLVLVGMALLRHGAVHPPALRPVAVGAVCALAATAVFGVLIPKLPAMSHSPASLNRAPPALARIVLDPLDAMAAFRDADPHGPARPVFRVSTDHPSTGYLAVAILDDYDGALWGFNATFEPSGLRVPAAPGSQAAAFANTVTTQRVTLEAATPIGLLPAAERPISVKGVQIAADSATGMVMPVGLTGFPLSYTAVSRSPDVILAALSPADGIAPSPPDLSLPSDTAAAMATTLRFLSTLTGERLAANLGFLQSILDKLHADERRIDPSQPAVNPTTRKRASVSSTSSGGTSLSEVINAVTVNRSATPEQFATLFAMVARYLGVPARVVAGFRIAGSSQGSPLPAGTYDLTNRQAWAWVEIPVAGIGWVVADPTPDATTAAAAPRAEQVQAPPTTLVPRQANAVPSNEIAGGHAVAKPSTVRLSKVQHAPVLLILLLSLAAALVVLLLIGPGLAATRRAVRRRSRHSDDSAELAVGAWLELLDGLSRAGMSTLPGATTAEVAVEAGVHFGPEVVPSLVDVAALADRAVFSSQAVDAPSAARAWATQRAVCQDVRRKLDRRQRARALLSVGPSPRRPASQAGPGGRR